MPDSPRSGWLLYGVGLLVLLAACRAPIPTPTATPSLTPTLVTRGLMPTPAPTWTPTFTPSPAPPTLTPTITDTPTPEPTRSRESICAGFVVEAPFGDGHYFPADGRIDMIYGSDDPRYPARFIMVHRLSGQNLGIEVPGGQFFGMQLPVERLPRHGLYDWTLSLVTPEYGEICVHTGYLIVGAAEWDNS